MILTKEKIDKIDLDYFLNNILKSNAIEKILIIVPTNRKSRFLKKEIISSLPQKNTSKLYIETIGTLAEKLLEEKISFIKLSEASQTVFIKQSTLDCNLKYFTNYKNEIPRGTLEKITNVISEYKKHGITPEILKNEAGNLSGSEKLKALDISEIYEKYINRCNEISAFEIGDIYKELNDFSDIEFENFFEDLYPEVETVLVNGFDEFTKPEITIIDNLSLLKKIKLYFNFDYYNFNPMIFSHLNRCHDRLVKKGFNRITDISKENLSDFKEHLRNNLSLNKEEITRKNYTRNITKISASDRFGEITSIAKEIKQILKNDDIQANEICVVLNIIGNYSSIIRNVFSSYGIPFNLTDRISLSQSPPVITIINFLEILENNFYYKNIFRALESGFIDIKGIDTNELYKTASELKIVVGKDNWINSITNQIQKVKFHPGENSLDSENKIDRYNNALDSFNNLNKMLEPFNEELTIDDFFEKLKKFVFELNLPKKLLNNSLGEEEKNIKSISTFFETLDEIFFLLKKENKSDKKFKLNYFLPQIKTAVNWARFNVKEKPNYGVLVTSVNEIRGLQFGYLFVAGLVDGDFPTKYSPEIFFSGSFAKEENHHYVKERYHFYQALCSWNKKLFLCNAELDSKKELSESTFLKDFNELFEISHKTENDYKNYIYSDEEELIFAGNYGLKNFEKNFPESYERKILFFNELIQKISVDKKRSEGENNESIFNGFLNSEDEERYTLSIQEKEKLKSIADNQYSVTQLETYAKCPFKFFTERILKLETVEDPSEEIEALELGSLIHSVLFEFYIKLQNENIVLKNCDQKTFNYAEKLISKLAENEIEKYKFSSPIAFFEKEKLFGLNGNKNESILYKFLEEEKNDISQFNPAYFEVSFGSVNQKESDTLISTTEPLNIGGAKLRGKIDRVEVDEGNKSFNITDYKLSGKKIPLNDLENGLALQLPVYMLAARELLNENFSETKYSPNGIFIYSLKYSKDDFGKKEIKLTKKRNVSFEERNLLNEKIIDVTTGFIKSYIENISLGIFNLTKLENRETKVCGYCEFKSVCRISEIS